MEVDLSPKSPQKYYGSDGGSYNVWLSSDLPMLSEAKVGAGKLILEPRGLALPHYADSAKIGFVLQGTATVGIVSPEGPKEKVVKLKQGDAIPLNLGVVSWWYNDGDSEFIIVFLGETKKAYTAGVFTYFFLTGTNNIFNGFSNEFLSKTWDLDEESVNKLMKSQTGQIVVKVKEGMRFPKPCDKDAQGIVFNFNTVPFDVDVKNGGRAVTLTHLNLPLLGEIGLSANLVKLDADATCSIGYLPDSAVQMIYIVSGSGRVEITGIDGAHALKAKVTAGSLFVVPRFFGVSKIADGEGLEWFSVITSPLPGFSHFGGKTSLFRALSPSLLEAAFNVDPHLVKLLRSDGCNNVIFVPPPN
ncbi:glutelin type-D 1-like [Magnolia sinica]|uniref:glutelin type-D 1-like n=1 Tax=Magnolia sinica TaxID=86752 RepID=UPI0026589089|nr:glutelin type-D 1-like [Magnolia sinica]